MRCWLTFFGQRNFSDKQGVPRSARTGSEQLAPVLEARVSRVTVDRVACANAAPVAAEPSPPAREPEERSLLARFSGGSK